MTFDLNVFLSHIDDPAMWTAVAVGLTFGAVVYAVLSLWMYLTTPEDSDE